MANYVCMYVVTQKQQKIHVVFVKKTLRIELLYNCYHLLVFALLKIKQLKMVMTAVNGTNASNNNYFVTIFAIDNNK